MNMIRKLLLTDKDNATAFIIRIGLGIVIFPHGAQKLLGWFGGYGYTGTMSFFTETVGLPYILGVIVILAESAGALMLIAGIASRFAALGILAAMIGAMFTDHIGNGFFMNWFGNQAGEGIEYFILAIAMSIAVLASGSGRWSVDALLTQRG